MRINFHLSRGISVIFALIIILFSLSSFAQEKSLYERLGGVKPISLVVDDFIDRLVNNDILNVWVILIYYREYSLFQELSLV